MQQQQLQQPPFSFFSSNELIINSQSQHPDLINNKIEALNNNNTSTSITNKNDYTNNKSIHEVCFL